MCKSAKPSQAEIRRFIALIRRAAPKVMRAVFTRGGCYSFHLILADKFPGAIAYTTKNVGGHVISRIGSGYWDIRGMVTRGQARYRRMKPHERGRAHRWCCDWDDLFR
jgi:hypothetical protein